MKIKRNKYDILFSNLVRERADYVCERCGAEKRECPAGLDCAHYIGRGCHATRFHARNAFALCSGCHSYFDSRASHFYRWTVSHLGNGVERALFDLSEQGKGMPKRVLESMHEHNKSELSKIKACRDAGKTGRIEWTPFDHPCCSQMSSMF